MATNASSTTSTAGSNSSPTPTGCNASIVSGPLHDLEQAEGWEAAVLKLEERLKMARTDMAAGRAPTRSPET